jgi:hypothetical protein
MTHRDNRVSTAAWLPLRVCVLLLGPFACGRAYSTTADSTTADSGAPHAAEDGASAGGGEGGAFSAPDVRGGGGAAGAGEPQDVNAAQAGHQGDAGGRAVSDGAHSSSMILCEVRPRGCPAVDPLIASEGCPSRRPDDGSSCAAGLERAFCPYCDAPLSEAIDDARRLTMACSAGRWRSSYFECVY